MYVVCIVFHVVHDIGNDNGIQCDTIILFINAVDKALCLVNYTPSSGYT